MVERVELEVPSGGGKRDSITMKSKVDDINRSRTSKNGLRGAQNRRSIYLKGRTLDMDTKTRRLLIPGQRCEDTASISQETTE